MSLEESLHAVKKADEAMNARRWEDFLRIFDDDAELHAPGMPEPIKGKDAIREFYEGFTNAFPDLHVKQDRSFGQGEWVCAEYTVTGTHKGPLPGPKGQLIPPTQKPMRVANSTVYKVKDGKVKEVHEYYDLFGFMAQLGLIPEE